MVIYLQPMLLLLILSLLELHLFPGSVTINGISQPNLTPTTGIPVGTLNPRQIVTVTLEVQVTALPPNGIISNEANVTYTSQPDPTLPPITTTTPTQSQKQLYKMQS